MEPITDDELKERDEQARLDRISAGCTMRARRIAEATRALALEMGATHIIVMVAVQDKMTPNESTWVVWGGGGTAIRGLFEIGADVLRGIWR